MKKGKILVLLVLVSVPPLAYSKRESLRGQGVFPDDREWISPYRRKHLVDSGKEEGAKNYTVCGTQECKTVAEEFLSSMNKSIDPCEDFYEFACGGWSGKNVIPPSSAVWSRFMIVDRTVKQRIKGLLENAPEPSDILPVRQAKQWYRSCMDTESIEGRGVTPIKSILRQVGGWPITMNSKEWNSEEYTWQKVQRHYTSLTDSHAFFKITTSPPNSRSRFGTLMITPPKKTLSEQLPFEYRNYDAYLRLIESAADAFMQQEGTKVSKEILNEEAKEIVEFEKALFGLVDDGFSWLTMTFQDIEGWYNNMTEGNTNPTAKINITSVIQGIFDSVNLKIDPATDIIFTDVSYIIGLSELLNRTPPRIIVNYVHWTFVGSRLMYTTESLRNKIWAFIWQEYGVKERPPRWYECISDMKMVHIASYLFVDKYFTKPIENDALEMIKNIRYAMREKIENSNWLDSESKTIAQDKLDSMQIFLGFPEWYKNKTAVINYYKGITIGTDYFDNTLSYARFVEENELKKMSLSAEQKQSWYIDPITVNALYGPEQNIINLPAAEFQTPLFTRKIPAAVNYGIAGVMVGHEMGHGFDNTGIQYGKDGNDSELSAIILKSYYQRVGCFTDQFKEYYREARESKSQGINPKYEQSVRKVAQRTSGENIADTTGLQAVFQAYLKVIKPGYSSRLPGLEEYTEDQLFFLSFAAMWCKVQTPQYEEKNKESCDVHSPARLRVIGSVSNTKDFSKVFNCPQNSAMNPSDKCNIWEKSESTSNLNPSSIKMEDHSWKTQWKTYC